MKLKIKCELCEFEKTTKEYTGWNREADANKEAHNLFEKHLYEHEAVIMKVGQNQLIITEEIKNET